MSARLLLLVFAGGGVGSVLRLICVAAAGRAWGLEFPRGTLAINIVGSFLLGLLTAALPGNEGPSLQLKLALGTGVLGGFTTFSAFSLEVVTLLQQGAYAKAALYVALSVFGSIAGALAGWALGTQLAS